MDESYLLLLRHFYLPKGKRTSIYVHSTHFAA
jgi:hypothetical protein